MSKGPTNLRLSENELPKSSHLSREMCETAIAYLLLRGYLKEDFHLTPYNTISYLVAGKTPISIYYFKKFLSIFSDFNLIQLNFFIHFYLSFIYVFIFKFN